MALPIPAEPLVGRGADLAALADLLATDTRLVTLTGPAGAGKSRLALEVAHRAAVEAIRVELAEAQGVAGLGDAVAAALGVASDPQSADPVAHLGRALAGRGPILLLLDDLDALVAHAPATVGRLLDLAPEALFLVTSRERLRLPGEVVHEVGPLALPPGDGVAEGEAVELFVRAARRARSTFALTPAEAPFVAAIVRELDGLPLAIELCAARLAVMGARALLHRLGARFDVLRRGGEGRHATLWAALDASYLGLAAWEADALAQCAVFRGGFTLEAAEAVIDLRAHPGAPPALDLLTALREKSLLHAHEPLATPGELRLGMYASVREHARRKLDPAAALAAEARHAEAVVRAAEAWARERPPAEARARILLERDNLLAVLERVLERRPVTARSAEPALRALLVLGPVLAEDGPLDAHVGLLDPVLAATADSGADPRLFAHALLVRGALLRRRGQAKAGSRDLVRALSAATTLGDRPLEARVTHELGHALAARGEATLAAQHFEKAAALLRDAGDRAGMGDALASLGALLARRGRLDEAAVVAERALFVHRAERCPEAADLRLLGEIALDGGRLDEARARLGEARARSAAHGDRRGEALAAGLGGWADELAADPEAARQAYERAASALRELGAPALEGRMLGRAGVLCLAEGRPAEAYALLRQAGDRLGDDEAGRRERGIYLAYEALVDARVGRVADAERALVEAAARLAADEHPAIAALLEIARGVVAGDASAALAAARGAAATSAELRTAIGCVLRAARATSPPPPPDDALLVGAGGRWFRAPGGERVSLDQRRPLASVLDRLAQERLEGASAPLPWEALLAAGWPGERVLPAAGAHRVRVALSTLRKLGLKDVLSTTGDGYVLTGEVVRVA